MSFVEPAEFYAGSTSVCAVNSGDVVRGNGSYAITTTAMTNPTPTPPSASSSSTGGHSATNTTSITPSATRDDQEATCNRSRSSSGSSGGDRGEEDGGDGRSRNGSRGGTSRRTPPKVQRGGRKTQPKLDRQQIRLAAPDKLPPHRTRRRPDEIYETWERSDGKYMVTYPERDESASNIRGAELPNCFIFSSQAFA